MARKRQYGTGSVFKRGRTFTIQFTGPDGKRVYQGGFKDREEAKRVLEALTLKVRTGEYKPAKAAEVLSEAASSWLKGREVAVKDFLSDKGRWNNHIVPAMGHLPVNEITPAALRGFIEAKIKEGLDPSTVKHLINLVSSLFEDLITRPTETGVSTNPIRLLSKETKKLLRPTHHPETTPFIQTKEDVLRLYNALQPPYSVMFAVGSWAGLRPGEIKALRVGDLDFTNGLLTVARQIVKGKVRLPKSGKPRIIQLPVPLKAVLERWVEKVGKDNREANLFVPKRGEWIREHTLLKNLRVGLRACGLPEGLTWYQATRHTFGSQWVLAGGSLAALQVVMGHSSPIVTNRYAHLAPQRAQMPEGMFAAVALVPAQTSAQIAANSLQASEVAVEVISK